MEPEIARRCPSCGASVRGAAHFCPQCGGPMAAAGAQGVAAEQPALVAEAERVASSLEGRLNARDDAGRRAEIDARAEPSRVEDGARAAQGGPVESQPPPLTQTAIDRNTAASAAPSTIQHSGAAQASGASAGGGVRGRAAAVGAGVGEGLRPRVGRLRERSVVVLDEAADDPGLRFVLVAAALFVVALLLYVFSFVLR